MKIHPDWESAYRAFPVNEKKIHLNSCGTTPPSRPVLEALERHYRALAQTGRWPEGDAPEECLAAIRKILSRLLSCAPENIALVHNTAEAMHFVSLGLRLVPGDRILLLENEYPSNVYPWEHWKKKGVLIDTVALGRTQEEFLDNFKRALREGTRVAALSAVHWCTGMPLPLKDIAALAKEREITLVVDAAQGAGLVDIDVSGWGLNILAFSSWKWLLGPPGLGVLVMTKEAVRALECPWKGTNSVLKPEQYLPYQTDVSDTADRYMFSTPSLADWVYFKTSLLFLDSFGFAAVQNRIHGFAACLRSGLEGLGFASVYDHKNRPATGIVSVVKDGVDCRLLADRLYREGFVCRERNGALRFGPHIFNSEGQIEKTIEAVARLIKK